MDEQRSKPLKSSTDHTIRGVGNGIELFGVLIIVTGIAWSAYQHLRRTMTDADPDAYKIGIGRSLLLGRCW